MSCITKRRGKFVLVYSYSDGKGTKRQKWETFSTLAEAKARKIKVDYEKSEGSLEIPVIKTVRELMNDYVELYGTNKWSLSTYNSQKSLIRNYIDPLIGDYAISDVNPRVLERFYQELLKVKTPHTQSAGPRNEYVSPHVVREVHKTLRCAFNNAMKWELITRNPAAYADTPKEEHEERKIWDEETFLRALDLCKDPLLRLEMNLTFACSLRVGEMLGLTWDSVDISEGGIKAGTESIMINKELQRVGTKAMDILDGRDVVRRFPSTVFKKEVRTCLVLKAPKTATSVRKVFLPRTVAEELMARRNYIAGLKDLLGEDFHDYDLVFCHDNGTPVEASDVRKAFEKLIRDNDLPKVVFYSLRHMSITYKLKLTGGDIKAVQGDSGHAQGKMVTDVYSHIIDDDRKHNAELIQNAFYGGGQTEANTNIEETQSTRQEDIRTGDAQDDAASIEKSSAESKMDMLLKLLKDPETAALLKKIADKK